jgi:DNA-directed RNA polymerase sigma subunit (sigma70/sigma32)
MLGVTRERVRQIEEKAKNRLRQRAKMRALQEYLN